MKKLVVTFALFSASFTFSAPLSAQSAEFYAIGGVSRISKPDLGSGFSLDNGFRLGIRTALNSQKFFGHEFGYAYNRSRLLVGGVSAGGMAIHQGFYNYLGYGTKEGSRIRPFATAGVHFNNYVPPGSSATQGGGNTKFGINYGAGIKARVGSKFAIRGDFRQYLNPKPFGLGASGWLRQNEISAGFGLVL